MNYQQFKTNVRNRHQRGKQKLFHWANVLIAWLGKFASVCLTLLIVAYALKSLGYPVPKLGVIGEVPLAYLCGAFWLVRRAG